MSDAPLPAPPDPPATPPPVRPKRPWTILGRLSKAVREQNWFAVALELAIVVIGVVIGFQVTAWGQERADREGAVRALERLRSEVRLNIASLEYQLDQIEESREVRRTALQSLSECDASPEAEVALLDAIDALSKDIIPSFVDNTARELTRQDRYLNRLSDAFREALNTYDSQLSDERDQLAINFDLMWNEHILNHPAVDPDFVNGIFALARPLPDLCRDLSFRKQFGMTEVWHGSAVQRMLVFKEQAEAFVLQIDQELEARS